MSIMKVILEKIIHFLCYGTPNMTSRWLLWSPIIKEFYLIHYYIIIMKKHQMYTKSPIQGTQLETSGCWFCYLSGGGPSWIYPKWGFKVLQNLNPMILSQFCPLDISTLTEFGDSNLTNPISVTCQPPPVAAHIQCHVNGQNQGTGLFVINKWQTDPSIENIDNENEVVSIIGV